MQLHCTCQKAVTVLMNRNNSHYTWTYRYVHSETIDGHASLLFLLVLSTVTYMIITLNWLYLIRRGFPSSLQTSKLCILRCVHSNCSDWMEWNGMKQDEVDPWITIGGEDLACPRWWWPFSIPHGSQILIDIELKPRTFNWVAELGVT